MSITGTPVAISAGRPLDLDERGEEFPDGLSKRELRLGALKNDSPLPWRALGVQRRDKQGSGETLESRWIAPGLTRRKPSEITLFRGFIGPDAGYLGQEGKIIEGRRRLRQAVSCKKGRNIRGSRHLHRVRS